MPDKIHGDVEELVEKHGVVKTSQLLGVSREVVARIVGDLPVRAGSLALIERNIATAKRGEEPRK